MGVPRMDAMVMRIVTKFTTGDDFVHSFSRFCTDDACFIPSAHAKRVGVETGFSIRLADGTPMLRGQCVVLESWSDASNPFGRPGVRLGIRKLTPESKEVFARLRNPDAARVEPAELDEAGKATIEMPPLFPDPTVFEDAAESDSGGIPEPIDVTESRAREPVTAPVTVGALAAARNLSVIPTEQFGEIPAKTAVTPGIAITYSTATVQVTDPTIVASGSGPAATDPAIADTVIASAPAAPDTIAAALLAVTEPALPTRTTASMTAQAVGDAAPVPTRASEAMTARITPSITARAFAAAGDDFPTEVVDENATVPSRAPIMTLLGVAPLRPRPAVPRVAMPALSPEGAPTVVAEGSTELPVTEPAPPAPPPPVALTVAPRAPVLVPRRTWWDRLIGRVRAMIRSVRWAYRRRRGVRASVRRLPTRT